MNKKIKISTLIMTVMSVLLGLAAIYILTTQYIKDSTYDRLSSEVFETKDSGNVTGIDFNKLLSVNEDIIGWITVYNRQGNKMVDQPVVKNTNLAEPDYYLHHDVYKNGNYIGCPFLDQRCSESSKHLLIYGHNMSNDKMFSQIHKAYNQNIFNEIDRMEYYSKDGSLTMYYPMSANTVYKNYPDIQMFDFENSTQLRDQMFKVISSSTAKSSDVNEQLNALDRVITLTTCSSNQAGMPYRTLVVFGAS